jgi:hypothetical protein
VTADAVAIHQVALGVRIQHRRRARHADRRGDGRCSRCCGSGPRGPAPAPTAPRHR